MAQRHEIAQTDHNSDSGKLASEVTQKCLADVDRMNSLARYVQDRLQQPSGSQSSHLPECSIVGSNKPAERPTLTPKDLEKATTLPNGDRLTVNGANPEKPWQMENKEGQSITIKPQLSREVREPQWYGLSNGAIYTPAHPAINSGFSSIEAQPNNVIDYPDGTRVEFNSKGVVAVKSRK